MRIHSKGYYFMGRLGRIAIYILLVAWAVVVLMPLYWMFVTAFRPDSMLMKMPPDLLPTSVTMKNFETLFTVAPITRWLLNSLLVAVVITLSALVIDSFAGYSLSVIKPKGYNAVFLVILACMMVPDQIRIVPLFVQIQQLGWYNTYRAQIIPFMGSVMGVFMMRQFMGGLPKDLFEAAEIEGCGWMRIFLRIVAPLSKPVFAVLAINFFVGNWNRLIWPLILTSSDTMRTLPVGLSTLQGQHGLRYGIMMAGAALSAGPVIVLFLCLQKLFTKGIVIGAVKE